MEGDNKPTEKRQDSRSGRRHRVVNPRNEIPAIDFSNFSGVSGAPIVDRRGVLIEVARTASYVPGTANYAALHSVTVMLLFFLVILLTLLAIILARDADHDLTIILVIQGLVTCLLAFLLTVIMLCYIRCLISTDERIQKDGEEESSLV